MKNINNSKFKSSRDHDLIAELSNMNEHNYEDFLEEVSLDLSIYLLRYVLENEKKKLLTELKSNFSTKLN
jgi:hypothetical protein